MPTPKKGARLGGSPAHQKLILANLATSLFEHGKITTTEAKARVLRPVAEKLITKAKKGDLHNRRQVLATIKDKGVVHALFTDIAPRFAERPGGYTRITKLGPRKGDNAPMAVIELVTEDFIPRAAATPARSTPAPAAAPTAEAPAEDPSEDAPSTDNEGEQGGSTAVDTTAPVVTTDEASPVVTTDEASPVVTTDEASPVVTTDEASPVVTTDEASPVDVAPEEAAPVEAADADTAAPKADDTTS